MNRLLALPLALLLISAQTPPLSAFNLAALRAPAGEMTASNDPSRPILPNGRMLTPRGRQVKVAAHPYGLTLSPDGRTLVASCNGTDPFALSILTDLDGTTPHLAQITADRARQRQTDPQRRIRDEEDEEFRSVFMGVAIAPDNRTLYASSGNQGSIFVYDLATRARLATIKLNDERDQNSFIGALALTRDGRRIYALDQANYRVAIVDPIARRMIGSVPSGRAPFSLALSPDERRLYVTHVGLFRYSLVEGYDPKDPLRTGLTFPAFGFPSEEARGGVTVEGKRVPGLGDPNDVAGASVWAYEIGSDGALEPKTKTRTGRLIGEMSDGHPVIGGSSPSGVVAGRRHVFVSNANNDSVTVLEADGGKIIATIDLNLVNAAVPRWRQRGWRINTGEERMARRLRGQIPFGMALSRDERRLYVAEAGINAVAVIDAESFRVLGHIPTAWFPSQLALSADGRELYIANAKGYGSGPNGGPNFTRGPEGTYVGALQKGVIQLVPLSSESRLSEETAQVLANNGLLPSGGWSERSIVPAEYGRASEQIRYVVMITKENRTFDQVFGDVKSDRAGRRLRTEPGLAHYGERADVYDRDNRIAHRAVNITPNHHALAREFAWSDNFYLDADVSADGHRWLVGVYPNAWVETSLAAAYGGHRDFRSTPGSPGRLTFTGSSSALHPEDYLEAGSVWEHLHRSGLSFRNYGEGFELGGIKEEAGYEPTGARLPVNYPMPLPLFNATSREYPTFNMNIPDQYRWRQFERDFRARYIDGREDLPRFINIYLPNDHTARERLADGFPYRASYVADNDLALGRIIELLSGTRYWREMVIFVTEDDAQDGLDSIDAHRSLLLVISPYARRGYAMRGHTSVASIFKTIYLLLGLPPLNQYDAFAADLRESFSIKPDLTPYKVRPVDARIFDETKARIALHGAREHSELDDPEDFVESHRRYASQRK